MQRLRLRMETLYFAPYAARLEQVEGARRLELAALPSSASFGKVSPVMLTAIIPSALLRSGRRCGRVKEMAHRFPILQVAAAGSIAVVSLLALVACSRDDSGSSAATTAAGMPDPTESPEDTCDDPATGTPAVIPTPPEGTYVLDFTGSTRGGLIVSGNNNAVFTLDTDDQVRTFAFPCYREQSGGGIYESYIRGTVCPLGGALNEIPVSDTVANVATGDLVDVEDLVIDISPEDQRPEYSPTYCFAFRDGAGIWHSDEHTYEQTFDTEADTVRLEIPVHQSGIDAIYLAGANGGGGTFTRVTYTTGM